MCGRFTVAMDVAELQDAFPGVDFGLYLKPSYNVYPSQTVLTIPNVNPRKALLFNWGLIPPWSKDLKVGYKMINARSETLQEKPSYKKPFRKQRCLIPADGYYEWKKEGATKTPVYIRLQSGKPFAFAGLWEMWEQQAQQSVYSCTIITTEASDSLQTVHDRMPVILDPDVYSLWLDSSVEDPERLSRVLSPYPSDQLVFHPVSSFVNSPANNGPECIRSLVS